LKVVLLPQAQEDLDAIFDPLLSEIIRKLETLKEYPELGPAMSGPFSGYRSVVIDFFRIVYRLPSRDLVEVAYIRDCRRKPLS